MVSSDENQGNYCYLTVGNLIKKLVVNLSVQKQVRNLILLFSSSFFCAALAVAFLVFQYGKSDEVQVKNALVHPDVLSDLMNYQIDLVYFDSHQGSWMSNPLSIDHYAQLYKEIEKDWSVKNMSPEEVELFAGHFSTRLIVQAEGKYKTSPVKAGISRFSQEIEFASGGVYRVVTVNDSRPSWVYFRHPKITKKILNLQ